MVKDQTSHSLNPRVWEVEERAQTGRTVDPSLGCPDGEKGHLLPAFTRRLFPAVLWEKVHLQWRQPHGLEKAKAAATAVTMILVICQPCPWHMALRRALVQDIL